MAADYVQQWVRHSGTASDIDRRSDERCDRCYQTVWRFSYQHPSQSYSLCSSNLREGGVALAEHTSGTPTTRYLVPSDDDLDNEQEARDGMEVFAACAVVPRLRSERVRRV